MLPPSGPVSRDPFRPPASRGRPPPGGGLEARESPAPAGFSPLDSSSRPHYRDDRRSSRSAVTGNSLFHRRTVARRSSSGRSTSASTGCRPRIEAAEPSWQAVEYLRHAPTGPRGAERAAGRGECFAESTATGYGTAAAVPIIETGRRRGRSGPGPGGCRGIWCGVDIWLSLDRPRARPRADAPHPAGGARGRGAGPLPLGDPGVAALGPRDPMESHMALNFSVGLTGDFRGPDGRVVYRDIGLDVLEGAAGVSVRHLAEHRPELGPDQLAGLQGVIVLTPRVTAHSLSAAGDLLAVGRFGVGYDTVDVAACTAAEVVLFIAAGAVDRSVAEATVAWMLALTHHVRAKDALVRTGRWHDRTGFMGSELRGRTLGSSAWAGSAASSSGCSRVSAWTRPWRSIPSRDPEAAGRLGVRLVSLDDLLASADFVSVHCPLTEQTRGTARGARAGTDEADGVPAQHGPRRHRGRGPRWPGAARPADRRGGRRLLRRGTGHAAPSASASSRTCCWPRTASPGRTSCSATSAGPCAGVCSTFRRGLRPHGVVNPEVLDRPGFRAKWARLAPGGYVHEPTAGRSDGLDQRRGLGHRRGDGPALRRRGRPGGDGRRPGRSRPAVERAIRSAGGESPLPPVRTSPSRSRCATAIDETAGRYGGLQIIVNCAGIVHGRPLHDYNAEDWDRLMAVNVRSIFFSVKHGLAHLRRNARSYVVNVGSISSFVGQAGTPAYTASKFAVLGLSRSIALDYAAHGLRCNCVCPGITDTPCCAITSQAARTPRRPGRAAAPRADGPGRSRRTTSPGPCSTCRARTPRASRAPR